MELQAVDIKRLLPHRYPFLLVDRILEVEPGVRAVGIKAVTINEEFFNGHFPGHPIMPGVLVLEMMAQVSGIMLLGMEGNADRLAYLAGVDKCRFRKPVLPGDTLKAYVSLLRGRGTMGRVKAEAFVDGVLVCDAEMLFAVMPPDYAKNRIMSGTTAGDAGIREYEARHEEAK